MATQLIEFERTPNPNALRVLPGTTLWDRGPPIELHAGEDAAGVPLAQELLEIEGVASVMIGGDFVTILRSSPAFDWSELRPNILAVIADFVLAGRSPVATAQFLRPADSEDQDMIVRQIESPKPMPALLVVTKASKRWSWISGSMPGPVSATDT